MSNNSSGNADPNDGYSSGTTASSGGTITIPSGTGTSNGGSITITGGTISPGFPVQWISATVPIGGWGYIGTINLEPEAKSKKKDDRDGCDCKKCKEFYPYAEPNQDDGTLICYRCRHGW